VLGLAEDAPIRIASARYEWIARVIAESQQAPRVSRVSTTARIDRVAANLYVGPVLLVAFMGAVFWIVFKLSSPLVEELDRLLTALSDDITALIGPWSPLLASFLANGVVGGVGTMLSLVPVITFFYLAMGVLEDVGYMARAAYVVDSLMHRIGLHGKSFLPMFLGFGCNVPAVLGARILESRRARVLTVLLTPFVPCSGRMIVVMFITGAVFGELGPLVTFSLVALNVAVLVVTGLIASRLLFREENPPFVMEMPLYHAPNWRGILVVTWHHIRAFVTRAGTVILEVSVVVWALSTFPGQTMQTSVLAWIGRALEPAGALMGLDWRMVVSLLTSFVAKENTLATLSVLTSAEGAQLASTLPTLLSPASAAAFLVAQMLFVPCVATVTSLRQETGSWRLAALSVSYHTVLSFTAAVAVYQTLSSLGLGR
jgi:ferrous iron transport protein B